jgi:hypothetical protein
MGLFSAISLRNFKLLAQSGAMLIDDFTDESLVSKLGTQWRGVSDQVMGGISEASISHGVIDGRHNLRMAGDVRLENDGGFIQAALDLAPSGDTIDASGFTGVRIIVRGNGEKYSVHLRTPDNVRPWQSYRAHFRERVCAGLARARETGTKSGRPIGRPQAPGKAKALKLLEKGLGVREVARRTGLSPATISRLR